MSQKAETLFSEALELDPGDRAAFLDRECGDDAGLREEVDALLRDAERAEIFFGTDTRLNPEPCPPSLLEKQGDKIGCYTLREKIGEGGFGEVWLAEQERPLKRSVALKVIKAGLDTRAFLIRFDGERQALALMEHLNIAKVLDAGATKTGRPYFAMELVRGKAITQFCDEERLDISARLALFRDVCAAIGHAHQKGVIHCDLKPSNILVAKLDGKTVPKVIDFGIARATWGRLTDGTLVTQAERFLGTPAYMSPEQADGVATKIDTRSDIYGLGVLLYELLVGVQPFDKQGLMNAGHEEMGRIIREDEPPIPSLRFRELADPEEQLRIAHARQITPERLIRLIQGDLDGIVFKALEKEPERRYATTDAFAADIAHFLADEPVEASPPDTLRAIRKFARRHKKPLAVAVAIALILLSATGLSLWLATRASNAEKLASERLLQATRERDAKAVALRDAKTVTDFLAEVFRSPDPARDGRTVTVAETLDAAVTKLDKDFAAQPERHTKLLIALADTYERLGLYRNTMELREKVFRIRCDKMGASHQETLNARVSLVQTYRYLGYNDRADLLKTNAGPSQAFVSKPPTVADKAADQAGFDEMYRLAETYLSENRNRAAEELLKQILEQQKTHKMTENGVTVHTLERLSEIAYGPEKAKVATVYQERALAASETVFGRTHEETLRVMQQLAFLYWKIAHRYKEAADLRMELIARRKNVFGPDHLGVLHETVALALSLQQSHRPEESLALIEEALPRLKKIAGNNARITMDAQATKARCYLYMGRTSEGLNLLSECAPEMSDDTYVNVRLAVLQLWFGRTEAYEATRRRMLSYMLNTLGHTNLPHFYERTVVLCCLAPVSSPEMQNSLRQLLARAAQIHEINKKDTSEFQIASGLLELRCSHPEEALSHFQKAVPLLTRMDPYPELPAYQALALYELGRMAEARERLQAAKDGIHPTDKEEELMAKRVEYDMVDRIVYREASRKMEPAK